MKEQIINKIRPAFAGGRCVCRLIASFCIYWGIMLFIYPNYTYIWSAQLVPLARAFALVALLFVLLSAISCLFGSIHTDSFALLSGAILMFVNLTRMYVGATLTDRVLFSAVLGVAGFFVFTYFISKNEKIVSIEPKRGVLIAAAFAAFIFVLATVSFVTCMRYLTYCSPNFDFGIFCQSFRNMKKQGLPLNTCERDSLISHFAVHVSPVLYLLLPVYFIFPSPLTLQISQAFLIAFGVFPLLLICKKRKLSSRAALIFTVIYALYPAISCGTNYDFHENCFLLPLLLCAFCAYEYGKTVPFYVFTMLTLTVKEDAFIYIILLALYMISEKKMRRHALIVSAISAVYFAFCVYMLKNYGDGVMSGRFSNLIFNADDGLAGILKTFINNPGYVIAELIKSGNSRITKAAYCLLLFLPLGFLPFITKKPNRLLLAAPVCINLLGSSIYQYDPGFQYGFGISAFLFYASVVNYSELDGKVRKNIAVLALSASLCAYPVIYGTSITNAFGRSRTTAKELDRILETVPEDASVTASTFLLPHICDRDVLYEAAYHNAGDTDYAVLDMRPGYAEESEIIMRRFIDDYGYEIYAEYPDYVTILISPDK